ncbi:MAG TPA: YciI family protein [Candidatus Krumholzibacteria bacterium]|nr:YciI family protein [Candidatus Krumholzibacteria bacterium]
MSDDPNKNWTDAEAAVLRSLRDEPDASPGLEDRVVDVLKRRGHIRARGGPINMIGKTAGLAVAAAAVFIGGFVAGNRNVAATKPAESPPPAATEPAESAGNQYMLLMFTRSADPSDEPMADADYKVIVGEYRKWAEDRAAEGRLVDAHKLASATRVMTANGGNVAIESSADGDRVLGGYFLVTAPSLEDAVELTRTHPHLKYGGEVEVRPIEVTSR